MFPSMGVLRRQSDTKSLADPLCGSTSGTCACVESPLPSAPYCRTEVGSRVTVHGIPAERCARSPFPLAGLGHTRRVSRLIEPPVPREVAVIYDAVGNRVRGMIVSELGRSGPLSTTDLAQRVGIARNYALKHLAKLEEVGLVRADTPREVRARRVTLWSVDVERREQMIEQFNGFLRGQ
ncbi:ArsR family transcriptional regulator [Cellulomonas sp. HD19AZ1]|nr:ArsR family transcriptional regulator [Cellulomonas sp. HD19AZ1]